MSSISSSTTPLQQLQRQSAQFNKPINEAHEKSKNLASKMGAGLTQKRIELNPDINTKNHPEPPVVDVPGQDPRLAKAAEAAEGLVATTFIEPILKQVRESNDAPPPFGPSNAEKQFSALLDTKLSDEIVHAANFPLVERITQQLLKNMPALEAADQTPKQSIDTRA
tara:strand:- start:160775 stop:161275 length:501 start_codon:yes stop_codon:yes gene_type:complete